MRVDVTVAGFPVHKKKVLLVKHKGLKKWIPAGGHLEVDETPDDALVREMKEELNLDVEILNRNDIPKAKGRSDIRRQLALPFYSNLHTVGDHEHFCLFYLVIPKNAEQLEVNKDELDEAEWFTAKQLEQERIPEDTKNIALKALELHKQLTS